LIGLPDRVGRSYKLMLDKAEGPNNSIISRPRKKGGQRTENVPIMRQKSQAVCKRDNSDYLHCAKSYIIIKTTFIQTVENY